MAALKHTLLLVCLALTQDAVLCGIASTWDYCGCRWNDWMAWSDCSRSCGGGRRYRTREVWIRTDKCTLDFNNCATDDMGSEYSDCNTFCYNGGTFSSYCACVTGWYGSCCSSGIYKILYSKCYHTKSRLFRTVRDFSCIAKCFHVEHVRCTEFSSVNEHRWLFQRCYAFFKIA